MPRPEGLPKTGGRKRGTPNRKTVELESRLAAVGLDVPRQLGELLPKLDPGQQANVLLELLAYLYPKRRAVEHTGPGGEPLPETPAPQVLLYLPKNGRTKEENEASPGVAQ